MQYILSKRDAQALYKNVYKRLLAEHPLITVYRFDYILREEASHLRIRLHPTLRSYVHGYFKRNKVLVPKGNMLEFHQPKWGCSP